MLHHFPGFWNKEQRGQKEDFQGKKLTLPFPELSADLAAEAFFSMKQEGFVPSKGYSPAAAPGPGPEEAPPWAAAPLLPQEPELAATPQENQP